ncbi:MAG: serine/threonine protein kinase, partial [Myxococcales bacterium]|nr:serine/threonine protein kinase [Myxococcales bacterium]
GEVWRAEHDMLARPAAVKIVRPAVLAAGNDEDLRRVMTRFEREAQTTASLGSPNTVVLYDYGRTDDGAFYYAMELLEGIDLQRLVDDDGPQPASRVVHILRQVCGSLAEAHSIGLVHRDIKPGNIILCERGGIQDVAKVVDFGLVKDIGVRGAGDNLSVTDALVGTPLYMAPEAIKDPSEVGPRADLYALGAVGYFLLTGKPPFLRDSVMEICAAHLHEPPPSLAAELGEHAVGSLEELLRACLHKEPEDRPKSALALKKALMSLPGLQPWTEEDASEWWQGYRARHGDDVAPLPSASPPSVLTVSVSDRMTPRR